MSIHKGADAPFKKSEFFDYMVGKWHDLPDDHPQAGLSLTEYLNLTDEEYASFFPMTRINQINELVRDRNPDEAYAFDRHFD